MGQLLNVVAYVSGLIPDGSDSHSDYVLKKRNHLSAHANALADFGNALIERNCWASAYPASRCEAEMIVEENLDSRPRLHELRRRKESGEELSLVVVEPRDLCRADPKEGEWNAFKGIISPYISVIFAAGFLHRDRKSPIERSAVSQQTRKVCKMGKDVSTEIVSSSHSTIPLPDLDALQGELLRHTSAANEVLQGVAENIAWRRV